MAETSLAEGVVARDNYGFTSSLIMFCPECGEPALGEGARCRRCGIVVTGTRSPLILTSSPSPRLFAAEISALAANPNLTLATGVIADSAAALVAANIASTHAVASVAAGLTDPLPIGQAFGPRYRITKLLGVGGMGTVYQAWDAELNVAVALKVIRNDQLRIVTSDLERRFKNELLLARQVTHKNVVRIHDLGEIDGVKYISMPCVEGQNLARLLRHCGKLPVAVALCIARQVAGGLQAAHEAGVVHRDLKPANVMIAASGEDVQALIMDFGISASVGQMASESVIGTPEYMAPEQASGDAVGARADIYAFGLILYEMLTGPRLVASAASRDRVEAMERRFATRMVPIRRLDASISEPLEALVMRCLELDPAARFQKTSELTAALAALDDAGELLPVMARVSRRTLAAVGCVVALLLGGTYFVGQRSVPAAPVRHPMVAVLVADFENRSGDATLDGPLGAQALSIALEGAPYVSLFPPRDARTLAAQLSSEGNDRITPDMGRLISRREGIKVLVAGAIEARGHGYRVTVRATDPLTNATVASASEDAADRARVLHAIEVLASRVRAALGESKTEMEKVAAAETFTAGSIDAMRAYARAQDLASAGKVQDAIAAYQEAIAQDPQMGRAYSGMAIIYRNLGEMDKAERSFKEALRHVDRMTEREKFRTLGAYYLSVARNYPKAIETYDALVARYPADQAGLSNLALANVFVHNFARAVTASRQLVEMYPNYLLGRNNYAAYALYAGDFDTAIAETGRVLEANPSYQFAFLPRALAQLSKGNSPAALETYARLEGLNAFGASLAKLGVADAALYQGRYEDAVTVLVPGAVSDQRTPTSSAAAAKYVALADAYVALGRRDDALAAARKAAGTGSDESVLFPAALDLIWTEHAGAARRIANKLGAMLENQPRSYGRLIIGEIERQQGDITRAIDAVREAQTRHDSWWSRFLLGRLYVEAGHYPEALAELELAVKRRGEASDVFIADTPTMRYLPPAYYWLARAQEGVGATTAAHRSYEQFLTFRRSGDTNDPLVIDARRRVFQTGP